MTISLIHPSRERSSKAHTAASLWLGRAGAPVDYLLSIDRGEPQDSEYTTMFEQLCDYGRHQGHRVRICVNSNKSAVGAINYAATFADGEILVVMSDDFEAPQDWGKRIIELTQGKTDWIAKTPDGIQKWIITLPIMDRHYYNRFGYIYYPEFLHMFCDTELTAVADLTGRKIELNIPFKHNHYSVTKGEKDAVSIRADATWEQGEKLFLERAKRNFDLVNPPGKITSVEYLNYLQSKGIR